jgi:hypothetical protein
MEPMNYHYYHIIQPPYSWAISFKFTSSQAVSVR